MRIGRAGSLGLALWFAGVAVAQAAPAAAECERSARVFREGKEAAALCPEEARKQGLTIVELRDAWAPYFLEGAAVDAGAAPPGYQRTFVELANQRFGDDSLAASDMYLELYGVMPSLRVVLAAMEDEARHGCHAGIEDDALGAVTVPLRREDRARAQARREELAKAQRRVEVAMATRGVGSAAELAVIDPYFAKMVARAERLAATDGAIRAMQGHLVCEGLLAATKPLGTFDYETSQALARYQRRNWIVAGGELDADTRDTLATDSREVDLLLALRVLRARVVDAAGLIEDGSARSEWGTVLGRTLDRADMRLEGYAPLANGAPDRVSAATEAAAKALGWRDVASVRASLKSLLAAEVRPVALPLPPAPSYYSKAMELRAEIDRGDVVQADPRSKRGHDLAKSVKLRPSLTLFARDGAGEVALVRWPTTIGGWKDEKLASGAIVRKYKESDVGPRIWRDLIVAPTWYPPPSTPDDELVGLRDGRWDVKQELIGPSYRSAYGLAMLIHHEVLERRDGTHYLDHGIRTHGSVSYRSIVAGNSHGCHRLYNHHALRLANFLLRHRSYAPRGPDPEILARRVRLRGRSWTIHREDRGYRYELTPPVPIEVLAGHVLTRCT